MAQREHDTNPHDTKSRPRDPSRRWAAMGVAAAALVAAYNAPALVRAALPVRFDFTPIPHLRGYRRLGGGATSSGFAPLIGVVTDGEDRAPVAPEETLRARFAEALFGADASKGPAAPVASFSDYHCPYCRALAPTLQRLEAAGEIAVRWHEWPTLGPFSEPAAKATLAAGLQGAHAAFNAALNGLAQVAPTADVVAEIAVDLGLDPPRLLADMEGPAVATRLAETRGLAGLLGAPGTPALVVGRTLVVGAVDARTLRALARHERLVGPPPSAAA